MAAYEKARKLDPKSAKAALGVALAYRAAGQWARAITAYEHVSQAYPKLDGRSAGRHGLVLPPERRGLQGPLLRQRGRQGGGGRAQPARGAARSRQAGVRGLEVGGRDLRARAAARRDSGAGEQALAAQRLLGARPGGECPRSPPRSATRTRRSRCASRSWTAWPGWVRPRGTALPELDRQVKAGPRAPAAPGARGARGEARGLDAGRRLEDPREVASRTAPVERRLEVQLQRELHRAVVAEGRGDPADRRRADVLVREPELGGVEEVEGVGPELDAEAVDRERA